MQCPFCSYDSQVVDSRATGDGSIRRRRLCSECKRRFTTYERVGAPTLKVLKRRDRTEAFDPDKLHQVFTRICRHRANISGKDIDRMVRGVETQLLASGAKAIRSGQIATLVLARLGEVDRICYDRFASNYIGEDGQLRTTPPDEADASQLNLLPEDD